MFVRIVRRSQDPAQLHPEEETVQCDGFSIRAMGEHRALISMARFPILPGTPPASEIEINKDTDEIYLMNDRGQTIDSYRWPASSELSKPASSLRVSSEPQAGQADGYLAKRRTLAEELGVAVEELAEATGPDSGMNRQQARKQTGW